MSIGVGRKTRLLLGTLLLTALAAGFFLVLAGTPASAQANTLSLTKTDSPDPVNVGQDLTYTLTVRNNGPGNANSVVITDNLPANTTFVSTSSPTTCTYNAASHTVTCNVGSLGNGASAQRQIVVKPTTAAAGTTITNTARAESNRPTVTVTATTVVRPEADLSITKTASPNPALVGQDLTYTLTVTNGGPNAATNVGVTDSLPANTTFVSAAPSQGTCPTQPAQGAQGGTVSCDLGTVATGSASSATVTIVVKPTQAAANTSITNAASVSSPTRDPNSANNNASVTTPVNPAADLSVNKSGPATATNGQPFDYTVTVTNNGPSAAQNVVVEDNPPDSLTYNDAASSGACDPITTTPDPNDVRCTLASLASGASQTFTINVTPTQTGPLANQATVRSDTADPNNANNTSTTVNTTVNPAADLSISKSDSPDPVKLGQDLTYTLTATNGGPNTATSVIVTDNLPANTTFVSTSSPTTCTYNAASHTVTCNVGSLGNGASAQRQIVVRPTAAGNINNTATVSSNTTDTNNANNNATATTAVNAADLSIAKTDNPDPVLVNGNLSYTLSVSNAQGAAAADNVRITDTLPAGVTLNGQLPGNCSSSGTNPVTVTCDLGTVAPGQTVSRTIDVNAPGTPGTLENRARATSPTDSTPNDSNLEQTTVIAEADLSITKTDSEDPVLVNGNFSYTLSVSNAQGAGTATTVTVTDTLPGGVTLNGSLPAGCTSTGTNPVTVTCDLGTLNAGQTVGRTINVTASGPPRTLSNTATVSSPRDRTDASDTEETTVIPAADLSLTKTDSPDPATFGNNITYTLTATNNGPSPATGVVIRDTLPANAQVVSSSSGCTESGGVVTCNVGDLANGATATREVVVRPTAPGTLNNTATVSSDTTDPNSNNNAATAATTVNAADLSITKEGPATVGTGQPFSYTFTVNNAAGAATATSVRVEDTLPEGVTLDGPLPGDCSSTGTGAAGNPVKITCTLSDIPGGGSRSVSINVSAPNTPGSITNQRATATSPNDPETSSSNQVTTQVVAATLTITKQDTPDPVSVGQDLEYTVRVTNAAGGGDAADVRVADQLPANTTFVSATPSQGTCPTEPEPGDPGGQVECDLGTVMDEGTATITIVVRPTLAAAGTELGNEAAVQSPGDPDTSPTPKRATATTTVRPEADLSIRKEGPAQAANGQAFEYRLIVTNDGPNTAQNAVVEDNLPDGVTYNDGAASPQCDPIASTPDPNDVRCTLASLAENQSQTLTINVTPTQTGPLSNTATVSSGTADPDTANNTSNTVNTTVNPTADLSISKVDSPDPVAYGGELTYALSVANGGPNTATGVVVRDQLPAGVEFVSAPNCGYDAPSRTVTCNVGDLASGTLAQGQIVVRPTATGTVSNTATVASPTSDPNENNNAATATTTVVAANLSITKTDSPDPVTYGSDLTYEITVTNAAGAANATDVRVTDQLSDDVNFVSASNDCTFDSANRTVVCGPFDLAGGATATRQIVVRPTVDAVGTTLANSASVSSPNDPTDSSDAETTTVNAADLNINKSDNPDPVNIDQQLTYTIDVSNDGAGEASDVQVTDDLPDDVAFDSATYENGSNTGDCDPPAAQGGTVNCDLGTIDAGQGAKVTIKVTPTRQAANSTLTNQATVNSPNDPSGASTTEQTTVNPAADLSITKSGSPDPVTYGNELTYTLTVANNGPNAAEDATLTDQIPQNTTFEDYGGNGGGCNYDQQTHTVTCDLGTIQPDTQVTRQIVVKPTADAVGQEIQNTASVDSPTHDPSANNQATEQTQVNAADLSLDKSESEDPVFAGENFTYILEVTNAGAGDATNVRVMDTLPTGVGFVSAPGCDYDAPSRTVTCDLGTIDGGGGPVERRITVTAPDESTTLENTATVSSLNDPTDFSDTEQTAVAASANVSIEKTGPATVTDEDTFGYQITVRNDGPSSAQDVRITDQLPAGVEFVGFSSDTQGCQPPGQDSVVRCDLGTVAPNSQETVVIRVRAKEPGQTSNTAEVQSPTDTTPANNSSTTTTTVRPAADLSVSKSGPDTATNGQAFNYTLTVTNNGPNAAQDVVVTDDLPDGVAYNDGASTPSCELNTATQDPNDVRCTLASLAANQSQAFTINVTPTQSGQLSNTASVTSGTTDPTPANNTSNTVNTTVNPVVDLSLDKQSNPSTVNNGQTFEYTFTVSNAGPDSASGVTVIDSLPTGVEFVSSSDCTEQPSDSNNVTCNFGSVGVGGSNAETATITVKATQSGTITNTASVDSNESSPEESNAESTTVNPVVDLSITKSDSPDPVAVEQELTYTITVTNNGPSAATGVMVTDDLPNSVTYNAASSSSECSLVDATENVVECGPVSLTASGGGATRTFTIKVTPQAGAAPSITNTASVDGNEPDPDTTNNTDTAPTQVNAAPRSADLVIDKEAPTTVNDEDNFTYTLTVTNNGPDAAAGVVVEDDLPDDVEFVSSDDCAPPDTQGVVTCELGTLNSGDAAEASIVVKAKQPGPQRNVATVASDTPDPDEANNQSAEVTTTVTALADLSIEKGAPPEVVDEDRFIYRIEVTNDGPSDADGVRVTDELPDGIKFVSAPDGCANDAGRVRCDFATLASGDRVVVEIRVQAKTKGEKDNTATVTSNTNDPDDQNNSDSATTRVDAVANLSIEKSAPATVTDEQEFSYALVIKNNGPSDATHVLVTDRLPGGVSFVSASGGCRDEAGTVRCDLGTVANDQARTVRIVVRAKTPGETINRASVTSDTTDPNTQNSSDTAATVIRPQAAPSSNLSMNKSAPRTVTEDNNLTYTLAVRNNGPDAAKNVVVRDTLPADVSFVSASDSCGFESTTHTVTCRLGDISDGATRKVKVVVEANRDGTLRNRATVSGGTRDPNEANNSDTAATTVREGTSRCDGERPNIIKGTDGVDVLRGTPGNDVIYGYGGDDRIYGLGCNDSIIGGSGRDVLDGGKGADGALNGGSGDDRLYLKDGTRDAASGGPGRDRCVADRVDAVSSCP